MQRLLIAVITSVVFGLMTTTAFGQKSFPPAMPASEAGETSELLISDAPSQLGVVARRTIRDRSGKIAREVYYGSTVQWPAKPTEKDLSVFSIGVYFNDAAGRVDHIEHWQAADWEVGRRSPRIEYNSYNLSGQLSRKWFLEPDGIKRYEMRFRDSSKYVELYFDDTGKYLTSLRGHLVSDIDLPHGWGPTSGGMACGITLSTERGRFNKFELNVNIKNVDSKYLSIDGLVEPVFQLRDASGQAVPLRKSPGSKHGPPQLYGQGLDPEAAGYLYPGYKLADYFDPLPPGEYTIRILQPVAERSVVLASNDVSFVVL